MANVTVLDHVEVVHPDQMMSTDWRWGPPWSDGARRGVWVVRRQAIALASLPSMAIRLEFDGSRALVSWEAFAARLKDLEHGCLDADAYLRGLPVPETPRPTVAALIPGVAEAVQQLNERARFELMPALPEPAGCPREGQWMRVVLPSGPDGKWHRADVWDSRWGRLGLYCRVNSRAVDTALARKRHWMRLEVRDDRPAAEFCGHCARRTVASAK